MYDGLYTVYATGVSSSTAEADTMWQRIRGFYKSAGTSARITHIVGTGGNNQTEKITVQSSQATINIGPPPNSNDPFPQTSPSSDRSWANPTYNLTVPNPFGTTDPIYSGDPAYGDTVTTTVSASNTSPAACRAWAAIIYSTEVADVDHDGLPDGLEDAPGGLKDPDGAELPNLHAMGAASNTQNSPIRISSLNTTRCMLTRAQPGGQRPHPIPTRKRLATFRHRHSAAQTRLAIITSRRRRS